MSNSVEQAYPAVQMERSTTAKEPSLARRMGSDALALATGMTGGVLLIGIGAAGTHALVDPDNTKQMFRTPDAQESMIRESLNVSIVDKRIWLDCVAVPDPEDANIRGTASGMRGFGMRRFIDLQQQECDRVTEYGALDNKQQIPGEVAQSLWYAAHEAIHIKSPELNEAEVDCLSMQYIPDLAAQLGANPQEALVARSVAVYGYPSRPTDYRTADCYDGGPLDRYPDSPDVFPYAVPTILTPGA